MNVENQMLLFEYRKLKKEKLKLEKAIKELDGKQSKQTSTTNHEKIETAKQKEMKDLLSAYRLSGISVSNVEGSKVTLLFDTSYKDKYFESYYVEVETEINPSVIRHTLPYFIPITSIAQDYLELNLNQFASTIHTFVCNYVRRRQQVLETKEKYSQYFIKDIETTYACDYIRIDFTFRSSTLVSVILMYGLEDDLPQKVDVYLKNNDCSIIQWCKELYQKKYLENATEILVDKLE